MARWQRNLPLLTSTAGVVLLLDWCAPCAAYNGVVQLKAAPSDSNTSSNNNQTTIILCVILPALVVIVASLVTLLVWRRCRKEKKDMAIVPVVTEPPQTATTAAILKQWKGSVTSQEASKPLAPRGAHKTGETREGEQGIDGGLELTAAEQNV